MSSSDQPETSFSSSKNSSPINEGEWQLKCSTVYASLGHLFMNNLYSDIRFVPLMGASDPPKVFPAHKFVLFMRSPVFETQFRWDKKAVNGKTLEEIRSLVTDNSSNIQEVELADVDPVGFEEFLRFLYTDQANITRENIASIYYIANRYMVPSLKKYICESVIPKVPSQANSFWERFIIDREMEPRIREAVETVFELLKIGDKYDDGEAREWALKAICGHTKEIVGSKAFLEIDQKTLVLFASQEKLKLGEVELFNGLIRWAEKRQETERGKSLRELIGDEALFRIQFLRMNCLELSRFVVPKTVLTPEETIYLFRKLAEPNRSFDEDCPFPRFGIFRGDGEMLTLQIENLQGFVIWQRPDGVHGEEVHVNGFPFRINACILIEKESGEKYLDFSVCYAGCYCNSCNASTRGFVYDDHYSYRRSCHNSDRVKKGERRLVKKEAVVQWMISSSSGGGGKDRIGRMLETGFGGPNSVNFLCASIPLGELLAPENGLLGEDGSLTLRATVMVHKEFEKDTNES